MNEWVEGCFPWIAYRIPSNNARETNKKLSSAGIKVRRRPKA
jgi:hypothetical protein